MDKIANTCGHYDAYRKNADLAGSLVLSIPEPNLNLKKNECYNCDANELVKALYGSGDNPTFEVFTIAEGKATIADFSGEPPKTYEI